MASLPVLIINVDPLGGPRALLWIQRCFSFCNTGTRPMLPRFCRKLMQLQGRAFCSPCCFVFLLVCSPMPSMLLRTLGVEHVPPGQCSRDALHH